MVLQGLRGFKLPRPSESGFIFMLLMFLNSVSIFFPSCACKMLYIYDFVLVSLHILLIIMPMFCFYDFYNNTPTQMCSVKIMFHYDTPILMCSIQIIFDNNTPTWMCSVHM